MKKKLKYPIGGPTHLPATAPDPIDNLRTLKAGAVLTRKDRIRYMIARIQARQIDPNKLSSKARKRIILFFIETQPDTPYWAIADLLDVTESYVCQVRKAFIKESSKELLDTDILSVARSLEMKASFLFRRAVELGDIGTAWRIEKELIEKLQSFGFVYKAPAEIDIRNINDNLYTELGRFFDEFGAKTPAELANILREAYAGNGKPVKLLTGSERAFHENNRESGDPFVIEAPDNQYD
jgi:hypothetical protein